MKFVVSLVAVVTAIVHRINRVKMPFVSIHVFMTMFVQRVPNVYHKIIWRFVSVRTAFMEIRMLIANVNHKLSVQ